MDHFLVFDASGTVYFSYPLEKCNPRVTNAFINDIVINERKMKYVEGSEMMDPSKINREQKATDDAEKAVLDISDGRRTTSEGDGEKEDNSNDIDLNITLGTYTFESNILKYLIWTDEETTRKVYFTMAYSSFLNAKNPYYFLRRIKTAYENIKSPEEFEKFFAHELKTHNPVSVPNLEKSEQLQSQSQSKTKVDSPTTEQKKQVRNKKSRKWNSDGTFCEDNEQDASILDFSSESTDNQHQRTNITQLVGDKSNFGTKTKAGFLVNDLSDEMDKLMLASKQKTIAKNQSAKSFTSNAMGFLKSYIGGKKITKDDVKKIKTAMTQHLIKKNISPNVANSLMFEVEKDLVGQTTESFTSIEETAKRSLAKQLKKLLTPDSSIDLLHEIQQKKANGKGPYSISVVGVNGVGKSTNLSKLAFWLLQNDYRVLVAACDTFRSGAVEQLRTHVNNLVQLSPDKKQIELFESGYGGADLVAKIASGAIKYAKENDFDIVLMDTAGRRHNDSNLMAPLASFAKAANPDKIIMVGEALVGTDSVLQAQNFNKAFGANRHLDFFIISKCDTVGDLIGSMVNMVFATGIPILFVGTGQTYTDLRTLSVNWAVDMLMS